ncbi:protein of unknown function [Shewanella benthica]|uniref:Uncharacterized protein n=1 Tax=Shewanella benthica TaxID=43661 RepID=A0A330M829_9GAMM|nr:protein of unknown function [Shewanella benthica]
MAVRIFGIFNFYWGIYVRISTHFSHDRVIRDRKSPIFDTSVSPKILATLVRYRFDAPDTTTAAIDTDETRKSYRALS